MASLAEMDEALIVERTRAGLEVAKQLGRKGGRKPKMTSVRSNPPRSYCRVVPLQRTLLKILACPFLLCTDGCQPLNTLIA